QHLAQDVGLLNPHDDLSVLHSDAVEEARLEVAFGGRSTVQPAGGGAARRAVGDGDVGGRDHVLQVDAQVGQSLPDLLQRPLCLQPVHEAAGEPNTVLAVALHVDERLGAGEVTLVHGFYEAAVDIRGLDAHLKEVV